MPTSEETAQEDILQILTDPATDELEVFDASDISEITTHDPIRVSEKTDAVQIYAVGCSTGASTSIRVPVTAFGWHVRLGYFRADGYRIGLSPIVHFWRSYYPPSVIRARFAGRLPAGTRDLRAFWWYGDAGDGHTYWNQTAVRC